MARSAGALDLGAQTLRADRITVAGEEDLRTCPRSGSISCTVTLETETAVHLPCARAALSDHGSRTAPVRHAASGTAALVSRRPHPVYGDDAAAELRHLRRPAGRTTLPEEALSYGRTWVMAV